MKNIILCFFIIPVMTLSVFAEEVTFNDFEEITHESKPALRHKKTKEIYPVTFSEKFYSPDKTMYLVIADIPYTVTIHFMKYSLKFIYVFDKDGNRAVLYNREISYMTYFKSWCKNYIQFDKQGWYEYPNIYLDPKTNFFYHGGRSRHVEYWVSDTDIIYTEDFGDTRLGEFNPTDFIRSQIILKSLKGDNDGIKITLFPFTDFNDFSIIDDRFPKEIRESGDLTNYKKTIYVLKRYFSYYPTGKFDIDKYKYIFKKELEIDKSGKILSTTIPPNQFGVCLADNVRIRTSPDLNGTVVGHLKKDDTFEILDASESTQVIDTMEAYWYKIKTTTLTGWVYGYFIIGKPQDNDQR